MKLFELIRTSDISGSSGTGRVAQGVVFDSGWCALTWLTTNTSVAFYPSLETLEAIHGHNGSTTVRFLSEADASELESAKEALLDARTKVLDYADELNVLSAIVSRGDAKKAEALRDHLSRLYGHANELYQVVGHMRPPALNENSTKWEKMVAILKQLHDEVTTHNILSKR